MKKITLFFAFLLATFAWQTNAQTLNQPANWPNTNWTLHVIAHTGSDPQDIEADPTADSNFAYDDDDTGFSSHDVIAAESPVIDLTAAHTAGENFIKVTGDYVYRFFSSGHNQYLAVEYYDADTDTWEQWYQFDNESTPYAPDDNYCAGTHQPYVTTGLDISAFTATQLAGFKYRFIYNDDTTGGDGFNYGFCFGSPTVSSASTNYTPISATFTVSPDCANHQFSVDVEVTDFGGATSVTVSDDQGSATQQLTAPGTVTFGPYASGTTVNLSVTNDQDTTYVTSESVLYYCPPANDDCDNAIALTVNPDLNCGTVTSGTNVGATASSQADDGPGTPAHDVWFSFVATDTSHLISLLNVTAVVGTYTDMAMVVYDGSAGCGSLTKIAASDPNSFTVSGLTVGTTYLLRVYGYSNAQTNFDVCVGTLPPPPANDDCANAQALTINGSAVSGYTYNASDLPDVCNSNNNTIGDGVWYTFTGNGNDLTVQVDNVTGYFDGELQIFTGTCGNEVCVVRIDSGLHDEGESITFTSTDGEVYLVVFGGFSNGYGGHGTFDISVSDPTAIADNQISGFNYYPNPVNHTLNLSAKDTIEMISIANVMGQEVLRMRPNTTQTQVDMSRLQNGVYFVKAQVNGELTDFKVVKK